MVTVRVQGEGVGQLPLGSLLEYKTPLGSVGTQLHTDECCELLQGPETQYPVELIRTPEGAPQVQIERLSLPLLVLELAEQ